jgi:hypothetical protein
VFCCEKLVDRWHTSVGGWLLKPSQCGAPSGVPTDFESFFLETCRRLYATRENAAVYPHHLQRFVDVLLHEDGSKNSITGKKIVVAMPPRHLKTTISLAASLYVMLRKKHTKTIWLTYSEELMRMASGEFDKMAAIWGYHKLLAVQKTIRGNTLFMGSLKSPVTGKGANWNIIVDDPLKNMQEALSRAIRDSVWDNYDSCAMTRAEHGGVNYVMCGTRWHSDDPQGRCLRLGYEHLHYPAISDNGEALCPELRSLEFLLDRKQHTSDYIWDALYQGNPPDDKFGIFSKAVHYSSELQYSKNDVEKYSYGIDMAYTTNSSSDLSAYCKLALLKTGQVVIEDWLLLKCNVGTFFDMLKKRLTQTEAKDCLLNWYACAAEIGLSSEISQGNKINIYAKPSYGKLGNAQNLACGWNNGNVFTPPDWRDGFGDDALNQILLFSGNEGDHDDFMDALCAAYDDLVPRSGSDFGPDPRFTKPDHP